MAEPPVCPACGARHWFLDPCGTVVPASSEEPGPLAATASADEIERALKAYRQRREQSKRRMRRIRADTTGSGS